MAGGRAGLHRGRRPAHQIREPTAMRGDEAALRISET
jgi:hypothetical protein